MIRLNQLKIVPGQEDRLQYYVAKALAVREEEIVQLNIVKKSLDARKKPELFWIYTVDAELKASANFKRIFKNKNVSSAPEQKNYQILKCGKKALEHPPVVVGMGPAGLFAAYLLAKRGYQPIVLERGNDVDTRIRDVEAFWQGKPLKPNSNVQFGEGGAGTFSDGKLNTGVKDKDGRNRAVLEIFCKHGAKEDILYDGKPHIGTDVLAT
ncbi:MAG: NAD(P)-binding protein, partial [Lachnospiraceae bacterium]|nr:NAD(P)-binding protein [Lachnospiraceae bacterium]